MGGATFFGFAPFLLTGTERKVFTEFRGGATATAESKKRSYRS